MDITDYMKMDCVFAALIIQGKTVIYSRAPVRLYVLSVAMITTVLPVYRTRSLMMKESYASVKVVGPGIPVRSILECVILFVIKKAVMDRLLTTVSRAWRTPKSPAKETVSASLTGEAQTAVCTTQTVTTSAISNLAVMEVVQAIAMPVTRTRRLTLY